LRQRQSRRTANARRRARRGLLDEGEPVAAFGVQDEAPRATTHEMGTAVGAPQRKQFAQLKASGVRAAFMAFSSMMTSQ
jgi:hypothetical protein